MLRIWISFFVALMLTASLAMAQTTDPAAPVPAPAAGGGGVGDWWWLILVVALIAVAIWYFMRKRGTTGRI